MSCAFLGPIEKESICCKLYTCKAWSQCGESSVALDDWSYKSLYHSDHMASDCLYQIEMEWLRLQKRTMLFTYTCRWVTCFCNFLKNKMKSCWKNVPLQCYTSIMSRRKLLAPSHLKLLHGLYGQWSDLSFQGLFKDFSRTIQQLMCLFKQSFPPFPSELQVQLV